MFLEITGFSAGDSEDSSIKFELDVRPEFEQAVMDVLGWKSLTDESDGDLQLTGEQALQISAVIHEKLPTELKLYIGVCV